jgi:hypothetical protein
MKRLKIAVAVALLVLGVSFDVHAQGPFSAQIQAALRAFLTTANTWTGAQTFTNVTINGTCTGSGCGSAGVTTLTGTSDQIIASASTGAVTLSTPQSINTTSSPTFAATTTGTIATPYGPYTWTNPQTAGTNGPTLSYTILPPNVASPLGTGSGSCTSGTHVAQITNVASNGAESLPSDVTATATCTGSNLMRVNIGAPIAGVASQNFYMSKANTSSPLFLCSNTATGSTQITCSLADASLQATNPPTSSTPVPIMRFFQSRDSDTAVSQPLSGIQLWPTDTAASGDFTFVTRRAFPGLLSLATAASNSQRNLSVGSLYLGSAITAQTDRAQFTASLIAVGTSHVYKWCSSTATPTCATGIGRNADGVVEANNGTLGTLGAFKANFHLTSLWGSTTAPSIASGGCTSPAVTSNNGTGAFLLTLGTSCTGIKTMTLTMPAATHLWACTGNNNTSSAQQDANVLGFRATSTTAVVITNYARTTGAQADFTDADTLLVHCSGE